MMPLLPLSTAFTWALARLWALNSNDRLKRHLGDTFPTSQPQNDGQGGLRQTQDPQRQRTTSTNSPLLDSGQNLNLERRPL